MNHYRKAKIYVVVLATLLLVASRFVWAQEEEGENAEFVGKVVDLEKKPIENAELILKNISMGTHLSGKSNKKGEFAFRRVNAGKYEVTIQKEGFKTYTAQIELKPGPSPKVEITLAKEQTQEQKNAAEAVAAFKRGTALFQEKKIEEAIQEFDKAITLKPDFFEAYLDKGILLFQSMKDEEAEKCVRKAMELKPEDAKAKEILCSIYFEQSRSLLQNDKVDQALEKLKVIEAMKPDYPYLNFLLGYAYNKKNMKEEAIKYYELFLQNEPNAPQAGQVKALLEELKKK